MTMPPHDPYAHPQPVSEHADPVCPRHPDTVTYVRCQRCGRPTCTQCQRPAAVGVQCVDCVAQSRAAAPTIKSSLGFPKADGRPLVTIGIIAICVLVWLGQMASMKFYNEVAFYPILGMDEPWRFITSGFAHDASNPMHILFNMYALFVMGQYLEPILGRLRFAALYLVSVLGGSVAFLLMTSPPTNRFDATESEWLRPLVGASGGIFGLFLAVLIINRYLGRDVRSLVVLIGINALLGFIVPNVAWQAHLGGAVTGAIGAALLYALRRRPAAVQYGALAGLAVVLIAAAWVRYSMVDLSWIHATF